jgi:hypothetical protein
MTTGTAIESIEYGSLFVFRWTNGTQDGAGYEFETADGVDSGHSYSSPMAVLNHLGSLGWDLDGVASPGLTDIEDLIKKYVQAPNAKPKGSGVHFKGKRRYTR